MAKVNSQIFTSLLTAAIMSSSCAPSPQAVRFNSPSLPDGPTLQDIELDLSQHSAEFLKLEFNGEVPAALIMRMTENINLAKRGLRSDYKNNWMTFIWQSLPSERKSLLNSTYPSLMVEETTAIARKKIAVIYPSLRSSSEKIRNGLKRLQPALSASESLTLEEATTRAFKYVDRFEKSLPSMGLMPEVASAIKKELSSRVPVIKKSVHQLISELEDSESLASSLKAATRFVSREGINLPREKQNQIRAASDLAEKVDRYEDAQGALSTLISIWTFLEPQERETVFREVNQELYEYLSEQNQNDLICLQDPNCSDIGKFLAKKIKIEPELKRYGLERIRNQINKRGANQVREEIRKAALQEISRIDEILADLIGDEIKKTLAVVDSLKNDYKNEMTKRISEWANKDFEKDGPALKRIIPARADFKIGTDGEIDLHWITSKTFSLESEGSLMALSPLIWEAKGLGEKERRAILLGDIVELVEKHRSKTAGKRTAAEDVSARGFAEIIRGLSRIAFALREGSVTAFEELLGEIRAQVLLPEFPVRDLSQALFPKDAFLAITYSNLGAHLENITKPESQVFLVNTDREVTWADTVEDASKTPVMAGMVDRQHSRRIPLVRAEDISRLILALSEFLKATDTIEDTRSEFLLNPGPSGKIPRDEIVSGRNRIKLFLIGLANLLSHQFRPDGKLIASEIDLSGNVQSQGSFTVLDQALAIRALLAASNSLGTELYRWEAVGILYSMNKNLFRKDLGFYGAEEDTSVSPFVLLETIRALEEIKAYVPNQSRLQIVKLIDPWILKLSKLKIPLDNRDARP